MSKILYDKKALTYEIHLQQLKDRGLRIENDSKTLHLLEVISYYRLSGYWYPFLADKKNHLFKEESSFESAFNIYKFDRELRLLVLRELEKIEVAVRAKMIYVLSHNKGPLWYADPSNFNDIDMHSGTLSKIKSEFWRSDEQFLKAFKMKYSDPLPPSWMMMEVTSFGTLSYLYSNLKRSRDKRDIANYFGVNDSTFASWLHSIVYLRNVCAHHTRLWNRVMRITPAFPKTTSKLWLDNIAISSDRTYFTFSMMIYLLSTINPKHKLPVKIKSLFKKFPNIDPRSMGFPDKWELEPLWKIEKPNSICSIISKLFSSVSSKLRCRDA